MSVGSSYSTIKNQLFTLLAQRSGLNGVAISPQEPIQATDITGTAGLKDAIWFVAADGDYSDQLFKGSPLSFDESYGLVVAIQSIRDTTTGTQLSVDQRVDEMLYEVLDCIATDATLGVHSFSYLVVLPASFKRIVGVMPTGVGHGARCDLTVEVHCRHTFA